MEATRQAETLIGEIGRTITRYLGAQLRISLILTLVYAVGFALLGVPVWPLLALLCGFLNMIPMVGPVIGILIVFLLTWAVHDIYWALGTMGVFVAAQVLESFYLTPRILGRHLNLPPLWIFVALLVAGAMFGILGVVLVIPLMAVAAAVWRFTRPSRMSPK